MEGGNWARLADDTIEAQDALSLLSTHYIPLVDQFSATGNTSAAASLAARLGALTYVKYPDLWPETIRALLIHSAEWTPTMREGRNIEDLTRQQVRNLLTTCGYGVPNITEALNTVSNSAALVFQERLQPFVRESSEEAKLNQCHFYSLPWPADVLASLEDTIVHLDVTLSYYIDPLPDKSNYSSRYQYRSHGLRFNVISPYESEEHFRRRISDYFRPEGASRDNREDDSIQWMVGSQSRTRGSIHRDIWVGTAADLAQKDRIAIYPTSGWWKKRNRLGHAQSEARYSLIIRLRCEETEVDIRTPIENEVVTQIRI